MVAVKICGIRTADAARACVDAGADFAGFNFVPSSRRRVTLAEACVLRDVLGSVRPVGIFQDAPGDEIVRVTSALGVSWVQLHGRESVATCEHLRGRGLSVIKALPMTPSVVDELITYGSSVDAFLLDAPVAGSGVAWSWADGRTVLAPWTERPESRRPPLFIAGGVTPATVLTLLSTLMPAGVDVASGVETAGQHDPRKIVAFCAAVRQYAPSSTHRPDTVFPAHANVAL